MGNQVEIKVSREVAEYLLGLVAAAPGPDGIFEFAGDTYRLAASEAINTGLRYHTRGPRFCATCGARLYVCGSGKLPKYCSNACRQRAYRERSK